MYDGFYIYTPFTNSIPEGYNFDKDTTSDNEKNQKKYGLKPYIYYSCRYQPNRYSDFVITYSLDNYITIQGKINNENWNVSGYLLDGDYEYDVDNSVPKEKVQGEQSELQYIQENGTKYYLKKENGSNYEIFSIVSGDKKYINNNRLKEQYKTKIENQNAAENYYDLAQKFTNLVRNNEVLKNLKFKDAVDVKKDENGVTSISTLYFGEESLSGFYGDSKIFDRENGKNIEDSSSNFNEHRTAVIRYAIQKNLSIAIANFNDYSGLINEFRMPNLSETDWYKIINNISMISFLQGMPIGGKVYNGYSVVTNNKNKEVVSEDSIYITTENDDIKQYHQITCPTLSNYNGNVGAEYNINFERRTYTDPTTKETTYYFPKVHLGCYNCIVNQSNTDELTTYIVESLRKNTEINSNIKKAYFTALGRERYCMNRTNYEIYANNFKGSEDEKNTNDWKYITQIQ